MDNDQSNDLKNILSKEEHNKNWEYCENIYDATIGTDAIIILTDSEDFLNLDWSKISKNMRAPSWVFDTKGLPNTKEANNFNVNVWSVGEGS